MAESYPWFKFNVTKWMLGRIQRLSFAHHGAFLRLCCLYWEKEGEISLEDAELECTTELFTDLLKYKIVKKSKEFVQIDFMDELLAEKGDASNRKRDAALERWRLEREKKRNADEVQNYADAMHVHTDAMQIRKEEKREDVKGENFDFLKPYIEGVCKYFNVEQGKNFRTFATFTYFIETLYKTNRLDYFKTQFAAYQKITISEGWKHSPENFMGLPKQNYENGAWCAKTYEVTQEQKPKKQDGDALLNSLRTD